MTNTTAYIKTPKGGCIEITVKDAKVDRGSVVIESQNGKVYLAHLSNVLVVEEPNDE